MGFSMTPDFYGYDPYVEVPAATEAYGVLGAFFGVLAVFYLAAFAFGIVCYILSALGMYTIAKRRGIHNPWLAWLPVGDMWILGSISDQYQYVAKGKVRNRRKTLLGLYIAMFALLLLDFIVLVGMVVAAVMGNSAATMGVAVVLTVLICIAVFVIAILSLVFSYIALYDLFASCDPSNATTYLVLSIFFTVALPFFIFFSRKKDLGMPPRKTEPQSQPVFQPVAQPVVETPVAEEAPVQEAPVAEEPPVVEELPVVEEPL